MFEAGAISKVVEEGLVCPIVFGIDKTDPVGPLASFQAIAFDRTEVRQLLTTINNAAKEAGLKKASADDGAGHRYCCRIKHGDTGWGQIGMKQGKITYL